jgi:transposase
MVGMDGPSCPGCRERDARIAALERRVAELEALVKELLARLGTNASNSSLPPSANPPGAPVPVQKKKSKRNRGAQPGHPPHLKQMVPAERVNHTVPLIPKRCEQCASPLPQEARADDPPATRHQVAELPEVATEITEYQGHARTCPDCGWLTRQPIPAALRAHSCGPRLTAVLSYLIGCHHVSRRGAEEIAAAVFDAPIALGTVVALEQEMSQALAPAHQEALTAVQQAPIKHVDETGWKQAGRKRWLWAAATAQVAAFLIHSCRGVEALVALLSDNITGFLISDRWTAYNIVPVLRRQVCWAHLKRDFQKCMDRGGAGQVIGERGLRLVRRIFKAWHTFRGGGCSRERLQLRLSPVARELRGLLEEGCACADTKVANFCANLIALEPALWRFIVTDGVEPTNNHAERVLRRGVLWRKNAFGCQSAEGCRFVERILTVVQTRRLQGRNVLSFLFDSLRAHRLGLPAPQLLGKC